MLVDIFYLAAIWLLLAFALVLLLGPHLKHSNFFISVCYLALLLGVGDGIALVWFQEPPTLVMSASVGMLILGIPFSVWLRDWNAPGQALFLFALLTTAVYLFYALVVTALGPLSPIAFIFSFLLFL